MFTSLGGSPTGRLRRPLYYGWIHGGDCVFDELFRICVCVLGGLEGLFGIIDTNR